MGYKSALMALQNAKIDKHDIDLIIFSTLNPDYFFPGCGVLLQRDLELKEIPALDIRQQCSGFVYGLSVAKAYINSGMYKNILFVCSEQQSAMLDLTTRGRNISVLFGDGAGAVVISATIEDKGILSTHLYSEGAFAEELTLKYLQGKGTVEEKDDNLPFMNGPLVFKHAVLRFSQAINEGLIVNNLKPENLDLFIPHQANLRISEFIQKKLNLTDNQVYNNIEKYGNTTSASIPIALSEANKKGKVKPGDMVCFAAFGSGFTWGSAFVKW